MVENVNTPSSARIGRRGLNRRELLGADLAGATIVGFPYVSLARPHRVSNSGSSTRLAAGFRHKTTGLTASSKPGTIATR